MENPSCIDLYITNSPKSFQNTTTLDTGLSDYHKMVITVLKASFQKTKPKEFYYRDYRNLNREDFKIELQNKLNTNVASYELFEKLFLEVLDKHAPFKSKIIRGNQVPYMTKALRKAIMKRPKLETKYRKLRTRDSIML